MPRITMVFVPSQKGWRLATQRGAPMQDGRTAMQQLHKLPYAGSTPAPATIHSVSSSVGQSAGLWHRMSAVQVRSHTPQGSLAQLVERQTEDLRVSGSIPEGSTPYLTLADEVSEAAFLSDQ